MKRLALAIGCGLLLSACATSLNLGGSNTVSSSTAMSWKEAESNEFIPTNQKAANALITAAGAALAKLDDAIDAKRVEILATIHGALDPQFDRVELELDYRRHAPLARPAVGRGPV